MTRRHRPIIALTLGVALTFAASLASAQTAPVRIHAHAEDNRAKVTLAARDADGAFHVVCVSGPPHVRERKPNGVRRPFRDWVWDDCMADVAPGAQLRVTLGTSDEAHAFDAPDAPGTEIDLAVLRPSRGPDTAGGIALIVVGSAAAAFGILALFASSFASSFGDSEGAKRALTLGAVGLAGGAGGLIGGIVMLSSRSKEPRVLAQPVDDTPASSSRPTPPSAFTPLTYRVTF